MGPEPYLERVHVLLFKVTAVLNNLAGGNGRRGLEGGLALGWAQPAPFS